MRALCRARPFICVKSHQYSCRRTRARQCIVVIDSERVDDGKTEGVLYTTRVHTRDENHHPTTATTIRNRNFLCRDIVSFSLVNRVRKMRRIIILSFASRDPALPLLLLLFLFFFFFYISLVMRKDKIIPSCSAVVITVVVVLSIIVFSFIIDEKEKKFKTLPHRGHT